MSEATAFHPARLQRGAVHLHWFSTDVSGFHLNALEPWLDVQERARSRRFRFELDRDRYVARRGQLRSLLGYYLKEAPDRLEFDVGPNGKPALQQKNDSAKIQFNVSHSEGVAVAAIALDVELGVDIERIRPFVDRTSIAERMFTPGEQRRLSAVPKTARAAVFFNYWTRKEAVVKSTGQGLSYPFDRIDLSAGVGAVEQVDLESNGAHTFRWVVPVPQLQEGFVTALAVAGQLPEVYGWRVPNGLHTSLV